MNDFENEPVKIDVHIRRSFVGSLMGLALLGLILFGASVFLRSLLQMHERSNFEKSLLVLEAVLNKVNPMGSTGLSYSEESDFSGKIGIVEIKVRDTRSGDLKLLLPRSPSSIESVAIAAPVFEELEFEVNSKNLVELSPRRPGFQ